MNTTVYKIKLFQIARIVSSSILLLFVFCVFFKMKIVQNVERHFMTNCFTFASNKKRCWRGTERVLSSWFLAVASSLESGSSCVGAASPWSLDRPNLSQFLLEVSFPGRLVWHLADPSRRPVYENTGLKIVPTTSSVCMVEIEAIGVQPSPYSVACTKYQGKTFQRQ